ncbi:DUF4156 domain-containing protein [Zophobihabitans entericus]|uniref:DUF4156 domain-containing protein n=1 Tax=Zophobihabitans entericus TaxID=1635327 RepID=A0A6G9ID84_9GAMM|nr:DUF4156 domain-containing protein [Zophobihabitans entericus]QIQ21664.1 DUF4156 domain-containing protein [Zophobihabitans entericus]
MSIKKILLVSAVLALTACSSSQYTLSSAGANVQFVDEKPSESCQFLGRAEGTRGSFFSGTKTHSQLMRDAAIDLRNQAAQMGGNVIHNAQDASMKVISDIAPTDAVMAGDVYKCQ